MADSARPADAPLGMVDHLGSDGFGPTDEALAFARAYVADGEMDAGVLAFLRDPDRLAERARITAELRARDWPALGQYRDANAALAGQAVDVVFIGDSITEMWRIAQPDLFEAGVVNRGISGQTSPQILLRFMADVIALKPRAVHLMCGVNDICGNTGPNTPDDYRNNILAMVDLARANGVAVILAGLTPFREAPWMPGLGDVGPRVAALNAWLAELADRRGLAHADYFSVLAGDDGRLRPEFTRDGVHPVTRGYAAMRPITERAMARALGAA